MHFSLLPWVAVGGAVGACCRYLISELALNLFGRGFPYGTLIVNMLGSFIMGIVFGMIIHQHLPAHPWRLIVGVGMLGALTTFSTFSMDTVLLLQQGSTVKALANVLLNVSVCVTLAFAGSQLVNKLS